LESTRRRGQTLRVAFAQQVGEGLQRGRQVTVAGKIQVQTRERRAPGIQHRHQRAAVQDLADMDMPFGQERQADTGLAAEAVAIANDTPYGLSVLVIGADEAHATAVARKIQSGRVLVNTLRHEPLAPFGGMKQSGTGRESGAWGMEALEAQTMVVG